jgi:hypothetical protein
VEFFVDFFGGWKLYTSIKCKTIQNFRIYGRKSTQKMCFFHFISNKCIRMSFILKKPLPCERGGDFIDVLCIMLSVFFDLVIFHESQT